MHPLCSNRNHSLNESFFTKLFYKILLLFLAKHIIIFKYKMENDFPKVLHFYELNFTIFFIMLICYVLESKIHKI